MFTYLEYIGTAVGLVYVVLEIRRRKALWPVGMAMDLCYMAVFAHQKLWASAGLFLYFFVVSILGWARWNRNNAGNDNGESIVRRATAKQWTHYGLLFMGAWGLMAVLLHLTQDPAPVLDALIAALNAVALLMLTQCLREQWLLLMAANLISMWLYARQGLYPTTALYAVYLAASVWGWLRWRQAV